MKKLLLYLLLAALCVIYAPTGLSEIFKREGNGYLEKIDGQFVLHLQGTPYEIGYQHGKLLKEKVLKTLQAINDNQTEKGQTTEYMMYKMLRGAMHNRLKPHLPKRIMDEMQGMADACELKFEDVLAGNLFPEAFHCSGIALMGNATKDKSLYHVRILDFMTDVGFQENSENRNAFMNIGFAGFVGCITGMNEKQITIGEMGGAGQGHWDGMPMSFLIRKALEESNTLQEAMNIFKKAPRTCEYYYVISDAKIPDARGVFATPKQIKFIQPGENYAMFDMPLPPQEDSTGNKIMTSGFEALSSPVQTLIKSDEGKMIGMLNFQPDDSVIISGDDRYKAFAERLLQHYGKVDNQLLIEMIKRPVSMKSNLHNAIFHPSTLEAWVAVADKDGGPACNQAYHHFTLTKRSNLQTSMSE